MGQGNTSSEVKERATIKGTIPFSHVTKKMTVCVKQDEETVRSYTKGASEIIIEDCSHIMDTDGSVVELTPERQVWLKDTLVHQLNNQAFRTLALAYKDLTNSEYNNESQLEESGDEGAKDLLQTKMTLVAIFGIKDPLRPGIQEAIEKCRQAHVHVRMVTGDNIETAIAIAKDAGILPRNDEEIKKHPFMCMTGAQFRAHFEGVKEVTEEDGSKRQVVGNLIRFREIVKDLKVLARSTPMDKYILVSGLMSEGKVVAVTGDGTNDAPALKRANVGFSMGLSGTEVAKEASDIVLLDDNFGSLVTSIKWGRNVYASIRKFL